MERILIVEDDLDIAELVEINLVRKGYDVVKAHDGMEGLDVALKTAPDLIILDVMMPKKDGFSLYKDLRRDPRTSSVPVLFLTARAQLDDKISGLELGIL